MKYTYLNSTFSLFLFTLIDILFVWGRCTVFDAISMFISKALNGTKSNKFTIYYENIKYMSTHETVQLWYQNFDEFIKKYLPYKASLSWVDLYEEPTFFKLSSKFFTKDVHYV